jgi:hypothetical protein
LSYCTVDKVKQVLHASDASDFDDEIAGCITSAEGLVDALLQVRGLSVQDPVPQTVSDACAYYAAWLFRKRRDPAGAETFLTEATCFLNAYIEAVEEPAFTVGTA